MKAFATVITALCLLAPVAGFSQPAALKDQVLLRNNFAFKTGQKSEGASAFLISQDGKTYAVTAKHLLTGDMGIEPAVKPSQFNATIKYWRFLKPATGETVAEVDTLLAPDDDYDRDILFFSIKTIKAGVTPLKVATQAPVAGDTGYVIGCPYAEPACNQNIYAVKYSGADNTGYYIFEQVNKIGKISGFSGAPVVNAQGEVVAVLRGGVTDDPTYGSMVFGYKLVGTPIAP
ncbi:S1 family peptidase [Asticcacaulis sp. AC460]|uniref:S1 family peptidase n=1 Tax=Asticcacaulis sp. AC460 TaxID=1282360 RepID=UPI00138AF201|nr:serine protease [Asticcacaulis sp. AC460]